MRAASIWLGWDAREHAAFDVARHSINRHLTQQIQVRGVVLNDLKRKGLYRRPTERRINSEGRWQLWDEISQAPCATEFSISRFLVPHLAKTGLAMFADCDILARDNVARLFEYIGRQDTKAVWCVKHDHRPDSTVKMDGQIQTRYAKKNWSSVCVFDCDHVANKSLTVDLINTAPGRDLHAFCWLADCDIGELPVEWNWLAGHSDPTVDPKIVHHTDGSPCMAGFENVAFADEWRDELERCAA